MRGIFRKTIDKHYLGGYNDVKKTGRSNCLRKDEKA